MWTLSRFSDEISPDFQAQCALVSKLGLSYLEFRSAWDVNILDLDDNQLAKAKEILSAHGLGVSSIGSPIGKIPIEEDFEPHLERMRHAADVANYFKRRTSAFSHSSSRPGPIPTATVTRCCAGWAS